MPSVAINVILLQVLGKMLVGLTWARRGREGGSQPLHWQYCLLISGMAYATYFPFLDKASELQYGGFRVYVWRPNLPVARMY